MNKWGKFHCNSFSSYTQTNKVCRRESDLHENYFKKLVVMKFIMILIFFQLYNTEIQESRQNVGTKKKYVSVENKDTTFEVDCGICNS